MYCLSFASSRVRLGRALVALGLGGALASSIGACTVNEPRSSKAECLAGEPCRDAAADTQSEVFVGPDAQVEPSPTTDAAGTTALCPIGCNPEDVQSCGQTLLQLSAPDSGGGLALAPIADLELTVDASFAIDGASSEWPPGLEESERSSEGASTATPGDSNGETWVSPGVDAALDGGADAAPTPGSDAGRGQLDVLDAAAGGGHGSTTPVVSCQLVSNQGAVASECRQAGSGSEGAACASARDCAPGLGCVGSAGAGQCLPYCCGGNDSCREGTYCTQKPLRSLDVGDAVDVPTIPVCAVADNCSLMLGPCTEPEACSCPAGLACTIVRASTTACVEPGSGQEGESCPCAPGYFCSQGTNTCLKFCNTKDPASNCGARECQPGPSGFPMGWGLCVGD